MNLVWLLAVTEQCTYDLKRLSACFGSVPQFEQCHLHNFAGCLVKKNLFSISFGEAGADILKPSPNDYLQRRPVSKRVNSSKADADDATLIERLELA